MYIVVLLWIQDVESIVFTTLGWELVHTLCCVPYLGPLPPIKIISHSKFQNFIKKTQIAR